MILRRCLCALLPLTLALVLVACGGESTPATVSAGEIRGDEYHYPDLGWTMPIPPGWRVLSASELRQINEKGRRMIETTTGEAIVDASVKLIFLRESPTNLFTSAAQLHDEATDGPYAENQNLMFDVILQSYRDAGIPIRHAREHENIDGISFEVLHVTLLSPDASEEVSQQRMYLALLGPTSLTVSVTASDERQRNAMLTSWRASKFDRSAWTSAQGSTAVSPAGL